MKVKIIAIILCLTLVSLPLGCANVMEEHKGAAVGPASAERSGGVMGAVIGHGTGAVVVGTLAGALLGGAIGHFGYDQEKTREQTAKNYSYKETQGTVLRIESLNAMPASVRPGETVDLKMTYAVLHDSPDTKDRSDRSQGDYLQGRAGWETGSESRALRWDLHDDRSSTVAFEHSKGNVQGQGHG